MLRNATPKQCLFAALAAVALCIGAEAAMGRKLWGAAGKAGFWSGDINSPTNSQFVADPYSFTHVTHGALFYGGLRVVAGALGLGPRLAMAVAIEAAWETVENTEFVVRRYREATLALGYEGDSIVNSVSDILACVLGFLLASRLPWPATLGWVLLNEVLLLLLIRDNLFLSCLMLVWPVPGIKDWQLGR